MVDGKEPDVSESDDNALENEQSNKLLTHSDILDVLDLYVSLFQNNQAISDFTKIPRNPELRNYTSRRNGINPIENFLNQGTTNFADMLGSDFNFQELAEDEKGRKFLDQIIQKQPKVYLNWISKNISAEFEPQYLDFLSEHLSTALSYASIEDVKVFYEKVSDRLETIPYMKLAFLASVVEYAKRGGVESWDDIASIHDRQLGLDPIDYPLKKEFMDFDKSKVAAFFESSIGDDETDETMIEIKTAWNKRLESYRAEVDLELKNEITEAEKRLRELLELRIKQETDTYTSEGKLSERVETYLKNLKTRLNRANKQELAELKKDKTLRYNREFERRIESAKLQIRSIGKDKDEVIKMLISDKFKERLDVLDLYGEEGIKLRYDEDNGDLGQMIRDFERRTDDQAIKDKIGQITSRLHQFEVDEIFEMISKHSYKEGEFPIRKMFTLLWGHREEVFFELLKFPSVSLNDVREMFEESYSIRKLDQARLYSILAKKLPEKIDFGNIGKLELDILGKLDDEALFTKLPEQIDLTDLDMHSAALLRRLIYIDEGDQVWQKFKFKSLQSDVFSDRVGNHPYRYFLFFTPAGTIVKVAPEEVIRKLFSDDVEKGVVDGLIEFIRSENADSSRNEA